LNLRVAPVPRSSGNASDRFSPGFPWAPSIFQQCRGPAPRVTPVPRPLGCAVGWLSGLPLIAAPRCCRLRAFPGCPGPCTSTAGSMMTPRLDSNLASAACAVDESSSQSGLAHPEPGAHGAFPSFNLGLLLTGLPRPASGQDSNWCLHRPSRARNCVPNSLSGHQLDGRDSRPCRQYDDPSG